MRAFRKWASQADPTRAALLRHFAEAVSCLEAGRAAASGDATRGELQKLIGDLQGLRAKLEIVPESRVAALSTIRELQSIDSAVEAIVGGRNDGVTAGAMRAARDAVATIARQFA